MEQCRREDGGKEMGEEQLNQEIAEKGVRRRKKRRRRRSRRLLIAARKRK